MKLMEKRIYRMTPRIVGKKDREKKVEEYKKCQVFVANK